MGKERVAVAYSGGIDSTVVAYDAVSVFGRKNVVLLNAHVGRPTDSLAQRNMSFHAKRLGVKYYSIPVQIPECVRGASNILLDKPDLSIYDVTDDPGSDYALSQEILFDDYAPGMYTILWAILGAKAMSLGCTTVFTGCYAADTGSAEYDTLYPDTDARFVDVLNTYRLQIWGKSAPVFRSPLISKEDTVALGRELGVDFSKTHSCGFIPACDVCLDCIARKELLDV